MALNAPYTPNTVIQSTQVSNDLTGLANGTNDTANNSMATFRSEVVLDHVASGCVWSGDSYGSTRNASMTSGVIYLGGVRLTVSAVSARSFTASKDTYIDLDTSGAPVYTEVSNNAASPALTTGNIRIGIIITGATTIANAGSVNQGEETKVLPIASSVPYQVTDSLGNLICCRDPLHRVLGYRQRITDFTVATSTVTQVTELSCPVIVPTARKIKITGNFGVVTNNNASGSSQVSIWEGAVVSGSQLSQSNYDQHATTSESVPVSTAAIRTASSSLTYNMGVATNGTGTTNLSAAAARPIYILVELK